MTRSVLHRLIITLLMAVWLLSILPASAQDTSFAPNWLNTDQPHVKIDITEDGVYRITGGDLSSAGVPLSDIDPASLRLIENGQPIPLHLDAPGSSLSTTDALYFVGQRNRGDDEAWAYNYRTENQSSTYKSLYSDTTHYWLTWGDEPGPRYDISPEFTSGEPVSTVRDTVRLEEDRTYYYGDSQTEAGSPIFTSGEGYYWNTFNHGSSTSPISRTYDLPVQRKISDSGELDVQVRLKGQTNTRHRATLEVETAVGYTELDEIDWNGYNLQTLTGSIPQSDLPEGTVTVRVTSHNEFGASPNRILLDWVEAHYDRNLTAANNTQSFTGLLGGARTYQLDGYSSGPVFLFNTTDGRLFQEDSAAPSFSDAPSGEASYWAASESGILGPEHIQFTAVPDLASTSNAADYVILTTGLLRQSAEQLAEYRRSHNDFSVSVVDVQDVFNQFDYGRPTPIAIRRFVHQSQSWSTPPEFMVIWADANFPVRTAPQYEEDAPWDVPSFGYAPSDPWFAMQYSGLTDWTEVLSIGRLPIQSDSQGELILQKIQDYESAQLQEWQKRTLLLSGGTSASERRRLLAYSEDWAETAASPPVGADTLFFSKRSDESLDTSFQDRLRSSLQEGAGWLNYFGHSAAQSWEIVTDPPGEFNNAGRLPFVVSLGCQTGAFAGGRFDDGMSYGEQLLLGIDGSGNPTMNGAIAHFGTSYLGSITASGTINDHLIHEVFEEQEQIAGRAVRQAKTNIASSGNLGTLMRDHLLQYSLLGDPALTLSLPDQPDLHVSSENIRPTPAQPLPNDTLQLDVRVENRGTVPEQDINLVLDHTPPAGQMERLEQTLSPFRLEETVRFTFPLGAEAVGQHHFRTIVDPEQQIDEVRTDNNQAERTVTVFARGVQIVQPHDRSIVRSTSPTFRLAVVGVEDDTPLELQLAADSSFTDIVDESLQTTSTLQVDWTPSAQLQENETYYWRARIDEDGDEEEIWQRAAFTVRPDIEGTAWLQQGALFAENNFYRLEHEEDTWSFTDFRREVLSSSERGFGALKGQFQVDGDETYERLNLGFGLLLMDGATGDVIDTGSFCTYPVSEDSLLDSCTGGVDGDDAIPLLEEFVDQAEDGDHLFLRTRHLGRASTPPIHDDVRQIFRTLTRNDGTYTTAINDLTYADLWIMHAQIGDPGSTINVVEPSGSGDNEITLTQQVTFTRDEGYAVTPMIGPAMSWGYLQWSLSQGSEGNVRVDVLSADEEVLIEGTDGPDAQHHLSGISATNHRYLRLRVHKQGTNASAPQLDSWYVTYDPPAELAIDQQRIELSADSVAAGQSLNVSAPIMNLTDTNASDVEVIFEVTDESNRTEVVATDTLQHLSGNQEAVVNETIATTSIAGYSTLTIRANQPGITQRLQTLNAASVPFYVIGAGGPSNVRVLVEGRELPHDGEPATNLQDPRFPFVGAQPSIEIEIGDLDATQALTDPSRVGVYLDCDPTGADFGCRSVSESDTTFVPASSADEEARVYYEPDLSGRDTTHTLRVLVQDRDGSTITAPDSDVTYQLHFRVQSELDVVDLYPYPNPMVSYTQFAFRIMGGDISTIEDFRIRIYTLTGQLIRELDVLHEITHQDWNSIEWDGSDQAGNRVATGVYLYQVFMRTMDGPMEVNDGEVEKIVVIR